VNNLLQSDAYTTPYPHAPFYVPSDPNGRPYKVATKLTRVRHAAEKVMLYEESETSIDDGAGNPWSAANLLSVRHDRSAKLPDRNRLPLFNPNCRGNVTFADGHADYVPRSLVNDLGNFTISVAPQF
jgi:prepilin-type processing-associated H-X9-DG protein